MIRRDLVNGLGLANLVFVRAWFLSGSRAYFAAYLPLERAYVGLVIDFCLLALLFAGISAWSRRGAVALRLAAVIVAVFLLVPFDWLLRHATGVVLSDLPVRWGWAVAWLLPLAVLVVIACVRWVQLALVQVLPIIALPIALVTVPYAFMPLFARPLAAEAAPDVAPPAGGAKVLWLLFDSLSQRALSGVDPGPELPEFSRLMSESFVAVQATSPAGRTLLSIPAMSVGRAVVSATPQGYDLALRFADGSRGNWSRQDTVFRAVRRMGYPTQAVGWYHPYCDVLAGQFDTCAWFPMDPPANHVVAGMQRHAQEAIGALSLLVKEGLHDVLLTHAQTEAKRAQHVDAFRFIASRGEALAADMAEGLTYIHYPVPHPPHIGDLVQPGIDARWSGFQGNVMLADAALGALRVRLERDGVWDDMAVVITADHVWATMAALGDEVPLIVKLPGMRRPLVYPAPVSLLVLRDLLPRLVSREIATPEQLAAHLAGV